MTNSQDSSDLLSRVQRFEAAVEELRAAQANVRGVLHTEIIFDRWAHLGAEQGFTALPINSQQAQRDLEALNNNMPSMSESWAS